METADDIPWRKAISRSRDRMQSSALVCVGLPVLLGLSVWIGRSVFFVGHQGRVWLGLVLAISAFFALIAWCLRAATPLAAFCGGLVCLLILLQNSSFEPKTVFHTGLTPLILLFLITRQATHFRRDCKVAAGLAESKRGRNAAQIIANLGVAGMAACYWGFPSEFDAVSKLIVQGFPRKMVAMPGEMHVFMLAALAEATADTVSSEVGQALGGPTFLITRLRPVESGTDGAISLAGTVAGVIAAATIALSGIPALDISPLDCFVVFMAAIAGLFFDSLLGATIERKGWMGNDLVNLSSTAFAAGFFWAILKAHDAFY